MRHDVSKSLQVATEWDMVLLDGLGQVSQSTYDLRLALTQMLNL